jgi:hypothetical protein
MFTAANAVAHLSSADQARLLNAAQGTSYLDLVNAAAAINAAVAAGRPAPVAATTRAIGAVAPTPQEVAEGLAKIAASPAGNVAALATHLDASAKPFVPKAIADAPGAAGAAGAAAPGAKPVVAVTRVGGALQRARPVVPSTIGPLKITGATFKPRGLLEKIGAPKVEAASAPAATTTAAAAPNAASVSVAATADAAPVAAAAVAATVPAAATAPATRAAPTAATASHHHGPNHRGLFARYGPDSWRLWAHLATRPPAATPTARRFLRTWLVQFGLDSMEYWTYRTLDEKGVALPVDCTEPNIFDAGAEPAALLKTINLWYQRLRAYRGVAEWALTPLERRNAELCAVQSRREFHQFYRAYPAVADEARRRIQAAVVEMVRTSPSSVGQHPPSVGVTPSKP